jgi:hypothetical protein
MTKISKPYVSLSKNDSKKMKIAKLRKQNVLVLTEAENCDVVILQNNITITSELSIVCKEARS